MSSLAAAQKIRDFLPIASQSIHSTCKHQKCQLSAIGYRLSALCRLALFLALLHFSFPIRSVSAATLSIAVTTSRDYVDGNLSSITALQQNPGADKQISLREAMLAAEATPAGDSIQISFNMPATIGNTWEIYLNAVDSQNQRTLPLPALKRGNVSIDASTQPGSAPLPRVFLNGFEINEPVAGDNIGIRIQSANNVIRGIGLINFYDTGIVIEGSKATGNKISACMIGASPHGLPNLGTYTGILIHDQAAHNEIGGPQASDRMMIVGMLVDPTVTSPFAGVQISGSGTQANTVSNSWIGFWPADRPPRTGPIPTPEPFFAGIYLDNQTSQNHIGGSAPNVIAANTHGIYLNAASENTIAGNIVGLDPDGSTARPNQEDGISLKQASQKNSIGGNSAADRNVVSGNNGIGILVSDAGSNANQVLGNYVGLSSSGMAAAPNKKQGILVQADTQDTQIGSSTTGNYVAANVQGGILIQAASTAIRNNIIGLASDGTLALGNKLFGIDVPVSAATVGPGNIVAHSSLTGIRVSGNQTTVVQNVIRANANSGLCLLGAESRVMSNTLELNGTQSKQSASCGLRAAVLVYGRNHSIRANTIYNNQDSGILITNKGSSLISMNSISNNGKQGILLDPGSNDDMASPTISAADANIARGQACALCRVEVFADPNDEGREPLGSITADAQGNFSLRFPKLLGSTNLTSTSTNANNRTSAFSKPFALSELNVVYIPMVSK